MEASRDRPRNASLGLAVGVAVWLLAAVIVPVSTSASTSGRTCLGATATMVGTKGDDQLAGTPQADVIVGRGGDDDISGRGGDDKLCGGAGHDSIDGGQGSDRESGGLGRDNFSPPGDPGRDHLDGGRGVDILFFNDALAGIKLNLGKGFARAGAGRDEIAVGTIEFVYGSPSSDRIFGDSRPNVLFAGFESSGDVIRGRGGNDYIEGYESNDEIHGGSGDDFLNGGEGNNQLSGGFGADTVVFCGRFSRNVDVCGGGSPVPEQGVTVDLGAGTVTGTRHDSLIGIENAEGTGSNDVIVGDAGPNVLYGGPSADSISAGDADDMVYGDGVAPMPSVLTDYFGDESLAGPDGDDSLDGGSGTDMIDGGGAADTCSNGEQVSNCEA